MKRDDHLMFESLVSKYSDPRPITNYALKELTKMHEKLNSLSTAIELAHTQELDQVLSKIRDLADMLISESPKKEEGAENPASSVSAVQQPLKQPLNPVQMNAINMTAKAFNIPVNQATKLAQVIQAYQQA